MKLDYYIKFQGRAKLILITILIFLLITIGLLTKIAFTEEYIYIEINDGQLKKLCQND